MKYRVQFTPDRETRESLAGEYVWWPDRGYKRRGYIAPYTADSGVEFDTPEEAEAWIARQTTIVAKRGQWRVVSTESAVS